MPNFPLNPVIPLLTLAMVTGCGGGDDSPAAVPVALTCSQVTTQVLNIPGLTVASAVSVAASGAAGSAASYPAHCQVTGSINSRVGVDGKPYAIGFDIRLPNAAWNGKFFYSGDGGLDGMIFDPFGTTAMGGKTNALTMGYAVASSDGGHIGSSITFDAAFGLDPQARVDYGYNALGTLTPLAKKIVTQYFGTAPTRAYYAGCSKGGQSGMQAAARFADQFDGIIAGNPGFNLPKSAVAAVFDNQQLATVDPDITKAFASQDLAFVASRILAQCDALDGAGDGIVNDLPGCKAAFQSDRDVPQCASGIAPDGTCLSAVQMTALKAIMGGAKDSGGTLLYADWPWDPGIASGNWTVWKTFLGTTLTPLALANVFSTPPTPSVQVFTPAAATYWQTFDMNRSFELIYGTDATFTQSPMEFMSPPDLQNLTTLKSKSKLLVYHGAADGIFSVNDTIRWHTNLRANDAKAADYARLFVVPGMAHCGEGPATDSFDAFSALVNWAEQGVPPDSILATVSASNPDKPASWSATRSRPLCSYPAKAVLKAGATDLESAASFVCQ
jgi:pimeloyl-ACP methyl ester carboxylesterase